MATNDRFPFQTSFGFFTVCKGKNADSVDVYFNDNFVITLPKVAIWNKDAISHRLAQQRTNILSILQMIADNESLDVWQEKAQQLAIENKELKAQLSKSVTVTDENVAEVFAKCIEVMAKRYNEKGFITSRGKQILNKYSE